MAALVTFGKKRTGYYKGILMNADPELHEEVAALVAKHASQGALILDMGAGEGALSQRLFDQGFRVVSLDVNKELYKAEGPEFFQVDFNNVEAVNAFAKKYENSVDIVLGIEVIEHLENQWEYIRLLKKMVKKGGRVIVSTPNTGSWLSRFFFLFKGQFLSFDDAAAAEYGHVAPITPWELEYIFRQEGFSEIETQSAGFLPAIWVTSNFLITTAVMLAPLFRPFMKGLSKGWCVLINGKK